MSVSGGPDIVENGLVLCLDAGNPKSYPGSGTTWTDISRNGRNGTLTNGPTYSSANGGSILFDGTNDYVSCGNGSTLNNMSIQIWTKPLSNTGNFKAFAGAVGGDNTDYTTGFNVDMQLSSTAAFTNCSIEGGFLRVNNGTNFLTTSVPFGNWVNICFTISPSFIQFYLYGSAQYGTNRLNNGSSTIGMNSLVVGARPGSLPSTSVNANIASCSIYNRALSASEVLQNYNATKGRFRL